MQVRGAPELLFAQSRVGERADRADTPRAPGNVGQASKLWLASKGHRLNQHNITYGGGGIHLVLFVKKVHFHPWTFNSRYAEIK